MGRALRGTSLADYGISQERYVMLKNFCKQYAEARQRLKYGANAARIEKTITGNTPTDPTANAAIINAAYLNQIDAIEAAIYKATRDYPGEVTQAVFLTLTEGIPAAYVDAPICDSDISALRRLALFYLDQYITAAIGEYLTIPAEDRPKKALFRA